MTLSGRQWPLVVVYLLAAALLGACTSQQDLADAKPAAPAVKAAGTSAAASPAASEPTADSLPTEPSEIEALPAVTAVIRTQANADVLYVVARQESENSWQFTVTVEHPDTGWEDYADGWDVVLPDGTVSKPDPESPFTRLLLHPHENEQPFTRSQGGVKIEPEIAEITVRAHDLVDGFGGRTVQVDLLLESGPDYEVQRSTP